MKKILFPLVCAFLSFALLEIVLAVAGVPVLTNDGYLSAVRDSRLPPLHSATEWKTSYRLNALGLRDREITPETGEFRVLCLGDSCTFGTGDWLGADETYPPLTERLLSGRFPGSRVRVINAGIPGYSSQQGYRLLGELFETAAPDVVTVYFGWNDHWSDRFDDREKFLLAHIDYALNSSRTVVLLNRLISGSDRAFRLKHARLLQGWERRKLRVPPPLYRESLEAIVRECGERGVKVVLFTSPAALAKADPGNAWFREQPYALLRWHEIYNRAVRETARRNNVPLLDLAAAFDGRSDRDSLFADFAHPGKRGHPVIARALADLISSQGWISAPAPAGAPEEGARGAGRS